MIMPDSQFAITASTVNQLAYLARRLLTAGHIFILGPGPAWATSLDLRHRLASIGLPAIVSIEAGFEATLLTLMAPGDVLILIAAPGQVAQARRLLEGMKRRTAFVVSLVCEASTELSDLSDLVLAAPAADRKEDCGTGSFAAYRTHFFDLITTALLLNSHRRHQLGRRLQRLRPNSED